MKLNFLLFLTVIAMVMSCSVVRDHPKQVPPNSQGPYLLTLKILNDEAAMNNVRSACMGVSSYDAWHNVEETGNYVLVHLQYNNIAPGSLNSLLENLHSIRGLRVIHVKPATY